MMTTSAEPSNLSIDFHLDRNRHILINSLVFLGIALAYCTGLTLLLLSPLGLNLLGVFCLGYSIILAAYLKHEAIHGIALPQTRWNRWLGQMLSWIDGTCYKPWQALVQEHLLHHQGKDIRPDVNFADTPRTLRQLLLLLEWAHIPATSLMVFTRLHLSELICPGFQSRRLRWVVFFRWSGFILLGWFSLKALVLYAVAYNLALAFLRFQAAFQHNEAFLTATDRARDRVGTFSLLLSEEHPWLNSFLLNFGYHNAHHQKMACPWYLLPQLDRDLFRHGEGNHILDREVLADYHRYRLLRIKTALGWQEQALSTPGA